MVDVGYFIEGRHGVIKAVKMKNYSDTLKYMSFTDGDIIFKLNYENIEYIIPHEEVCKPYTEEQMIALCQSVDKPPTNAEKFKEVFGFEPSNKDVGALCDIMSDSDCGKYPNCSGCPIRRHCEWDDKWEKPNE